MNRNLFFFFHKTKSLFLVGACIKQVFFCLFHLRDVFVWRRAPVHFPQFSAHLKYNGSWEFQAGAVVLTAEQLIIQAPEDKAARLASSSAPVEIKTKETGGRKKPLHSVFLSPSVNHQIKYEPRQLC